MLEKITTHQSEEDVRNRSIFIYIDGKLVPREKATVNVYDSGFMLGDGIWEGLRLFDGSWIFLDEPLTKRRIISIIVAMFGAYLVFIG